MKDNLSTTIHCDHFPLCSGCSFQKNVNKVPIWKDLTSFFTKAAPHLNVPLIHKETTGWRTRAKLAVRGTTIHPEIGLFKRGTHEVIPILNCPLHHPAINNCLVKVREKLIENKIEPYREELGTGTLRYVQCAVERSSSLVQLTLVVNTLKADEHLIRFVKQLYSMGGFHSIWLNFQPEKTNRILGQEWHLCEGDRYLLEKINTTACYFHPACFAQAHLSLFEEALLSMKSSVLKGASVIEYYAGIGVISLSLADQIKDSLCVEINPYAADCFEKSRDCLDPKDQKKLTFFTEAASGTSRFLAGKNVVIVDPPRKGLDPTLLQAIIDSPDAEQIVYLSCGPHSFIRDSEHLLREGWQITKAEGYLFFPGSDHVEVLCVFEKGRNN